MNSKKTLDQFAAEFGQIAARLEKRKLRMPEKATPKQAAASDEAPFLSEEEVKQLKDTILKDFVVNDQEMFIRICQKTHLDPFTKQLMIRPEKQGSSRGVIIAGIQGFLSVADRSGVYDGSDPILWCGRNGDWVDAWTMDEHPEAAKATVHRKDHSRPEVSVVRWNAVVGMRWDQDAKKKLPTDFWARMPDYMLGKCALAAALRKAFPSLLTGVYETSEIPDVTAQETASDSVTDHLQEDIAAQQARIEADRIATEKAKADGANIVQSDPAKSEPRDARKEVEPPDDIDLGPVAQKEDANWFRTYTINEINHDTYRGRVVETLTEKELTAAVKSWFPKVEEAQAKGKSTAAIDRCYNALRLAWNELNAAKARAEERAKQNAA